MRKQIFRSSNNEQSIISCKTEVRQLKIEETGNTAAKKS